jgi:hypothetical protein
VKVGIACAALAAMLLARRASACDCRTGVTPWPPSGSTIPTNGILVIGGNGKYRDLVAYIDQRHPALSCGKRVIPLRMKDLYAGYREAKALLVPVRALPPLTRCQLVLTTSRPDDPPLAFFMRDPEDQGPWRPWWMTAAGPDHRRPTWTEPPRWLDPPTREDFCGFPSGTVTAKARVAIVDAEGPVLVRVLLEDGREKNDYVLGPETDTVDVGHWPCGGAFELEESHPYRATFSAIDAAGNETRAPGALPSFTPP